MSVLPQVVEACFSNAIVAAALALVAVAVSRIYRRPPLTHIVWLLVLLKLITPPIVRIPIAWPSPTQSELAPPAPDGDVLIVDVVETQEPDSEFAAGELIPFTHRAGQIPESSLVSSDVQAADTTAAGFRVPGFSIDWDSVFSLFSLEMVAWVWLAGSVYWFGAALVRMLQFHRLLRHGKPAPIALQQRGASIAATMELEHCPELWVVPGRVSPLLWALGRRIRLILPGDLLASLGPEQQATLLAHELAHARRLDHWVRWVEFIALGLYWWHPVAWLAKREIRLAEEQCCDAWVVWALPGRARAYAEALLETVGFLSGARRAVPPMASGIGHVQLLRRRLTMILRDSLCPRVSWRVHMGAMLFGLGVLPLAPYRITASAAEPGVSFPYDAALQSDRESENIERRLSRLEEKLEKVVEAVEAALEAKPAAKPESPAAEAKAQEAKLKDAAKKAAAVASKAASAMQAAEQAKKGAEMARKAAEIAKSRAERTRANAGGEDRKPENADPEEYAKLGRQIAESIRQSLDPDRMADLGRQIAEAIGNDIDPEEMAKMGRQIGEAVNKNIDPKEMEELGRRIEQIVNEKFNPERMKDLERQIEEAVTKAFDPKRMHEIELAIEQAVKSFETGAKDVEVRVEKVPGKDVEVKVETRKQVDGGKSDVAKPQTRRIIERRATGERSDRSDSSGRDIQQLEQRMSTLEAKMDRLLNVLESKPARQ
jgi:beta-lactamase regulating signal transducer with metallopeptidase domain